MSNLNGTSYTQMIDRLQAFANGHRMISAFQHGPLDLIDVPKDQRYPVMHVELPTIQPVVGGLNYQFDIVFYDLPRAKEVENEYQRECISDMSRLALDLIAEIKNGNVLFGTEVTIDGTPNIDPFVESYSQVVTGVMLTIGINVPYNWNACDIPADYSVGGTGSGGSGSGSGAITLKVNGTNNAVQNVLNLVNGANITITDLGDGRVRISATGGGGGGADWGSIGGDIKDQADLIALLAEYVTTDFFDEEVQARIDGDAANTTAIAAEVTARTNADNTLINLINNEANIRQNADDALQLAINIVAGDLSTETTARQNGDATNAAAIEEVAGDLNAHETNTSNPHGVTKTQVGLGNVPNVDATTTANITDSTNKRFVTEAEKALIGKATQAMRTTFTNHTLAAGSTTFMSTLGATSAAESDCQWAAESPITILGIVVRIRTAFVSTSNGTYTIRVNGVDVLSLTIPGGSAAGVYTATAPMPIVVSTGSLISWRRQNTGASVTGHHAQFSLLYIQ